MGTLHFWLLNEGDAHKFFSLFYKVTLVCLFGHPYKVEKETPFNFQDGVCDRTPVVLHNLIFHLGAKNKACQQKYPEYKL